jgi:pyruvate carboxylase subunit B
MPGGALTSNTQMLRDNGLIDRYREVVKAMGEAIVKGGMGTSVTPVSQFYFQQAFNNVMYGPWTRIAEGYGKMVLGYFGRTPEEPDAEVRRLAIAQLNIPPTTRSPLEIVDADPRQGLAAARAVLSAAGLPVTEENLFIAAECHEKGILFLRGEAQCRVEKRGREEPRAAVTAKPAPLAQPVGDELTVRVNNRAYGVKFSDSHVTVNGVLYNFQVSPGIDADAVARSAGLPKGSDAPAVATTLAIDSQLSGILTRLYKKAGDKVAVGETVMVIDAMGVEVPVNSRFSGIVQDVFVHLGEQIEAGAPLFRLSTIAHGSERTVSHAAEGRMAGGSPTKPADMTSPIAGLVLRIYKEGGERVRPGESVIVLESMKMETPINCPIEGVIESIAVKRGDIVREGDLLARVTKKREDR